VRKISNENIKGDTNSILDITEWEFNIKYNLVLIYK
jgi:hypothetical protein